MTTKSENKPTSYKLKDNPTEPFRMRFSKKYAKKLVKIIDRKAEDENRSFPSAVETALVEHFGLK